MKEPVVQQTEPSPGAVLKVNLMITLFALLSVGYVWGGVWLVMAAMDAWREAGMLIALFVLVVVYLGLIAGLVVLERRILGKSGKRRYVCAACGYDLRGLEVGSVCPECGRREGTK